jgi:hypothetical protein
MNFRTYYSTILSELKKSINSKSATIIVGHLFFFALTLMAVVLYQERTLYYDPAFFEFEIINNSNFSIALQRWGAAIVQIFPLLAIKNGADLSLFLQIFSSSTIVFYYVVFLIIIFKFRDYNTGWILMLSIVLTYRLTFYYITAELYLGLALCVLWWALLKYNLNKNDEKFNRNYALLFLLSVAISYFHQLTLFSLVFFIFIEIIRRKNSQKTALYITLILVLIWYFIRIKILTVSDYEKEKMISIGVFINELFHFFDLVSTKYLAKFLLHDLIVPFLFFIAAGLILFKRRKREVLFTFAFTIGFFVMVCITLYRGESPIMYENYMGVIGLFMSVIIFDAFNESKNMISISVITFLLFYSLFGIVKSGKVLRERNKHLNNLIQYGRLFPEKKYIISEFNFKENYYFPSWTFPFETIFKSGIDGPGHCLTYYFLKEGEELSKADYEKQNVFLGPRWNLNMYKSDLLDKRFFVLPSTGYRLLSTSQDQTGFNDTLIKSNEITIQSLDNEYTIDASFNEIDVLICNNSKTIIPSIPGYKNRVRLTYHLLSENGEMISWDNPYFSFDVDLYPEKPFVQRLAIKNPGKKGNYLIQFDLITEGRRWWGINTLSKLRVK